MIEKHNRTAILTLHGKAKNHLALHPPCGQNQNTQVKQMGIMQTLSDPPLPPSFCSPVT